MTVAAAKAVVAAAAADDAAGKDVVAVAGQIAGEAFR